MASTRLSVINCRTNRTRLAPSAVRTAISRARSEPRASNRFARLTQAISRTNANADQQDEHPEPDLWLDDVFADGDEVGAPALARVGVCHGDAVGDGDDARAGLRDGDASPSRAIDRKIMLSRRVRTSSLSSAVRIGSQRSVFIGHVRSPGTTPAMTTVTPARRIGWPAIAGSAPKRRFQSPSEITATRVAFAS